MQTFLPYPSFIESARALDYRRLGKQRVEAKQILNALDNGGGWKNHPAVKMWKGYEDALKWYANFMIIEWIARGYNNNMKLYEVDNPELPPWVGLEAFHNSHKGMLYHKDPEYYEIFKEYEEYNEYFWPSVQQN